MPKAQKQKAQQQAAPKTKAKKQKVHNVTDGQFTTNRNRTASLP